MFSLNSGNEDVSKVPRFGQLERRARFSLAARVVIVRRVDATKPSTRSRRSGGKPCLIPDKGRAPRRAMSRRVQTQRRKTYRHTDIHIHLYTPHGRETGQIERPPLIFFC